MMLYVTPRKYRIATTNKLRDVLNMKIGNSSTGKEWCIKALHPSDPLTDVRGIPDQSCQPTTVVNWQLETVIRCNNGATGAWAAEITVVPDPLMFGCYHTLDTVGNQSGMFLNTQIGTGTYENNLPLWLAQAERWRLAYCGLTVYHDAPALSDQGTVAAACYPVEPTIIPFGASTTASVPAIDFQVTDVPDFTTIVRMPNCYTGQAKNGCYLPLKLSSNHMQWHSGADLKNDATEWSGYGGQEYVKNIKTGAGPNLQFPYYGSYSAYVSGGVVTQSLRCAPCNENWGAICFQNLSINANLTLVWRVGYEIQAGPTSPLSAYLHLSPAYDPQAIMDYYSIARELKDAWPADYNDLGKLWGVIKDVARKALPFVRTLGPIGAGIGAVGDLLLEPEKTKTDERDRPSRASVERAQAAVSAAPLVRAAVAQASKTPRKRPVVRKSK